jgi:hypothetical protein
MNSAELLRLAADVLPARHQRLSASQESALWIRFLPRILGLTHGQQYPGNRLQHREGQGGTHGRRRTWVGRTVPRRILLDAGCQRQRSSRHREPMGHLPRIRGRGRQYISASCRLLSRCALIGQGIHGRDPRKAGRLGQEDQDSECLLRPRSQVQDPL